MSSVLPKSIQNLIEEFGKLPGIGPKTASRLTFYLLTRPADEIVEFAKAIENLKVNLTTCQTCFNIAETNPCVICSDPSRDTSKICVLEEPLDVIAIERTGFKGLYHVLGGVISPINGIGPEDLRITELLAKIKNDKLKEIILATDPSLEGEATAMYIGQQVAKIKMQNAHSSLSLRAHPSESKTKYKKMKVTRIARGLPMGGDLEYADEMTLTKALDGRKEYK